MEVLKKIGATAKGSLARRRRDRLKTEHNTAMAARSLLPPPSRPAAWGACQRTDGKFAKWVSQVFMQVYAGSCMARLFLRSGFAYSTIVDEPGGPLLFCSVPPIHSWGISTRITVAGTRSLGGTDSILLEHSHKRHVAAHTQLVPWSGCPVVDTVVSARQGCDGRKGGYFFYVPTPVFWMLGSWNCFYTKSSCINTA